MADEGMAFFRGRMYEAALERFDGALALQPENDVALRGSAGALLALGRAEDAAERFSRYLELEPRDPDGHVGLAGALAKLGRKGEAIGALRAAVEAGLEDVRALDAEAFESLRQDIRFVQIAALLAQRAGVRPTDDRGRLIVGGQPVRTLELPSREAGE
ncbi:MAG TPA: tetratricopeptide repeat protein [Vulgatibacter sp.]